MHTVVILGEVWVGRGTSLKTEGICRFLVTGGLETVLFIDVREDGCTGVAGVARGELMVIDVGRVVVWKVTPELNIRGIHLQSLRW